MATRIPKLFQGTTIGQVRSRMYVRKQRTSWSADVGKFVKYIYYTTKIKTNGRMEGKRNINILLWLRSMYWWNENR